MPMHPRDPKAKPRDYRNKKFEAPDFASFAVVKAAFTSEINTRDHLECPLCHQNVKMYRRTIHKEMIKALVKFYHASLTNNDGWVNVHEIYGPGLSGDYAKLKFWGLIEAHDVRTIITNASGHWRITKTGKDFVTGKAAVQKYALVYNNECYGLEGPALTIQQCFGKKFDYRQQVWDVE